MRGCGAGALNGGISRSLIGNNPCRLEKQRLPHKFSELTGKADCDRNPADCEDGYPTPTALLARSPNATIPATCFSRVRPGNRRTRLCRMSCSASLMSWSSKQQIRSELMYLRTGAVLGSCP